MTNSYMNPASEVEELPVSALDALKYDKLSDKYQVIHTSDVLTIMREQGFRVTQANTLKPRRRDPRVVKHFLRMRHESHMGEVNGTIPEIIVINSHDGSTSLRMEAGLYRMVCSNGLIVKSSEIYSSRTRHFDVTEERVVTEAMKVIEAARLSAQRIERFMTRTMTLVDELEFAERAKEIKALNVSNDELLKVRRPEDDKNDLWTVFNRVQENIMRGGLEGVSAQGRRIRTGGVRSMGSTLKVNTSLWELAEEYV